MTNLLLRQLPCAARAILATSSPGDPRSSWKVEVQNTKFRTKRYFQPSEGSTLESREVAYPRIERGVMRFLKHIHLPPPPHPGQHT
jgi:hypothetical protein